MIIKPKSPYNIKPHWENYAFEQPQPHIYEDGVWRRALRLGNKRVVPTEVEINEDVEDPRLKLSFYADLDKAERKEVVEKLKWIFNTEYDLKPLYSFMDSDPTLRELRNHHYGLKPSYISTVYEGIITAIIQQQISLRIAGHMARLLIQKFGEYIEVNGKEFWEFPSPQKLSQAKVEDLRSCGLSGRKAEYIIDFSTAAAQNEFDPNR
jgi:DNA-3-methyladenine glycosylase II